MAQGHLLNERDAVLLEVPPLKDLPSHTHTYTTDESVTKARQYVKVKVATYSKRVQGSGTDPGTRYGMVWYGIVQFNVPLNTV